MGRIAAGVEARICAEGRDVQHSAALRARTAIALYRGQSATARAQVEADWPSYRRSLMPRIRIIRVQMTELRARCALAAIEPSVAPGPLLREAERGARRRAR